jgi:hypothetical protein
VGGKALQINALLNQYNPTTDLEQSRLSTTLSFPLFLKITPRFSARMNVQPALSLHWDSEDVLGAATLTLASSIQEGTQRTLDFFGPSFLATSAGIQAQMPLSFEQVHLLSLLSTSAQARIARSSAMIRLGVDVLTSSEGELFDLLPLFSFSPSRNGDAKLRATLSLRLPLGLLDIPVAYGGLTGSGLEVTAMSAWYLKDGSCAWEGSWAVGGHNFPSVPLSRTRIWWARISIA